MNKDLLEKNISKFVSDSKRNKEKFVEHFRGVERGEFINYQEERKIL